MEEDNVVEYRNPGVPLSVADALTEVLRRGAKELLQQAVEVEVAEALAQYAALKDEQGRWCAMVICRSEVSRPGLVR